jgi:hypothetical protein
MISEPEYRFRFQLGAYLGKTVEEIEQITCAEYLGWKAFIDLMAEEADHGKSRT